MMDYGEDFSNYNGLSSQLPADHSLTATTLSSHPTDCKIYIGLSRWGKKEYVGRLYPKGTKEKDFLNEYSKQFNAVELNSTAHATPSTEQIKKWVEKVSSDDFIFCPRLSQAITHHSQLTNAQALLDSFVTSISNFNSHLGPVFMQMPEKFSPQRVDQLFFFLDQWPREMPLFVELRDAGWFDPQQSLKLFSHLSKMEIGAVISDTPAHRNAIHMAVPIPKVFLRFMGQGNHPKDYDRIKSWADRIKQWQKSGLQEVYIFLHIHDVTQEADFYLHVKEVMSGI